MMFDLQKVRSEFPILTQKVNGKPLVYFDNAATSQKPQAVLDAISRYYSEINANIHRGVHKLSQLATDAYEQSREKIRAHINAKEAYEVLFTAGTTHGVNLVANGFASILKPGDEVLVSALEHHSNIVPWQMLCDKTGATLKVIPMNLEGELIIEEYVKLLSEKTKIVTVNHISNALGTVNPIKFMIRKAHEIGAAVFIDGAQAAPHLSQTCKISTAISMRFQVTKSAVRREREFCTEKKNGSKIAALSRRRRNDQRSHVRKNDVRWIAAQVRSRNAK